MKIRKRPVGIIVRDGWGHNPNPEWNHANAIFQARTPVDDHLRATYPHTLIRTSGEAVGLPDGVMGNSEVGHQNIGAGRIVEQEVMRITSRIRDGSFFTNRALVGAFERAQRTGGNVHLTGLCSDGQVHSDLEHLYSLLELAGRLGFPGARVFVHAILDGRDTPPHSGLEFVKSIEEKCQAAGVNPVASVIGRFWAMDRDNRWDRVAKAYALFTQGAGPSFATAREALQHYYDHPSEPSCNGDEFVTPRRIIPPGGGFTPIRDGDSVILFNFRGDRPRELTKAFVYDEFPSESKDKDGVVRRQGFERAPKLDLYFATMTAYEQGLPVQVAYEKPPKMKQILGEYFGELGLRSFRCAETEKYPHVTFFFNDYRDKPFPGEDHFMIPSPREVSTYDQAPEMSAVPVTEKVLALLATDAYDCFVLNYANCDMVGHTGNMQAAIRAVETVDACVGRVVEAVRARGGSLVITADHGNSELMINPETGGPHTMHTTFDVPLVVLDDDLKDASLCPGGSLADVAATALQLMGLEVPTEMTGASLLAGQRCTV